VIAKTNGVNVCDTLSGNTNIEKSISSKFFCCDRSGYRLRPQCDPDDWCFDAAEESYAVHMIASVIQRSALEYLVDH
jgi:hypothetical protein